MLLENEINRTLELTTAKVCAQPFHAVRSNAEDEPLDRSVQGSSQELLTFLSPCRNASPYPSRAGAAIASSRLVTHCQHVVQKHTYADISNHINEQTRVSLILHKTLFREVLLPASRRYGGRAVLSAPSTQTCLPSRRCFGFHPSSG